VKIFVDGYVSIRIGAEKAKTSRAKKWPIHSQLTIFLRWIFCLPFRSERKKKTTNHSNDPNQTSEPLIKIVFESFGLLTVYFFASREDFSDAESQLACEYMVRPRTRQRRRTDEKGNTNETLIYANCVTRRSIRAFAQPGGGRPSSLMILVD
jgi:hypothetical protein